MFSERHADAELQTANCPQNQGLAYSVAMMSHAEHCLVADEAHYLELPELALATTGCQT